MDATELLLKELSEATGVPGYEGEVRAIMRRVLSGLAADVEVDGLGSLIARLPGVAERPRVMLAAHMDEVGFMVRYITDSGFIRFVPLGGWADQVLLGHEVTIHTRRGDVWGVIGARPPHLHRGDEGKKVVEKDAKYIDVGARSRQEVEDLGVRVGDPIVPTASFRVLANGRAYMGKAWDDRCGCALLVDLFRALAGQDHPNTVYGVATVQEEVGLRGARTSAHCVDPDVAIVLEGALAGDLPDIKPEECAARLGGGLTVCIYDAGMIPNLRLRDLLCSIAEEIGAPLQLDAMAGGMTDGGAIQLHGRGVPALYTGVPMRHVHCHHGIILRDDYDAALRLLTAVIQRLDAPTVASLVEG